MKEKRDHLWFSLLLPLSFLTHDKWYVIGHKITHADSSQSQPSCRVSLHFFLLISLIFMSVFIYLCLLLFPPSYLLLPGFLTLTKSSKTFHTSATCPQLTCNVKSTFHWHWSDVSPVFPQPLLNPCLALRGPPRPSFTPCTLLWFTSAV